MGYQWPLRSFIPQNIKSTVQKPVGDNWRDQYGEGASKELYTVRLSKDFVDLTFPEAAEVCLKELNLLLIGVEYNTATGSSTILFNPSARIFPRFTQHRSNERTAEYAIFIAEDKKAVER